MLLFTDGEAFGTSALYSTRKDAFTRTDQEEAPALAAHVAIAMASVRRSTALRDGSYSRSVIGQALGILMERFDITQPVAFSLLTRLSSTHQIQLRTLAETIAETRGIPAVRQVGVTRTGARTPRPDAAGPGRS